MDKEIRIDKNQISYCGFYRGACDNLNLRSHLSQRLQKNDIYEMCLLTQGHENDKNKEKLYSLIGDKDDRIAYNALWIFCHFNIFDNDWLYQKHDDLIDRVMIETHVGKKRMMLSLLNRQPFCKESLRADFIDFCIGKIPSQAEPYAVRALCMKLAYEQCKFYPELLTELRECLDMITQEPLSSALVSTRKNILKRIKNEP